jgi:hypothetical protein
VNFTFTFIFTLSVFSFKDRSVQFVPECQAQNTQ